MPASPSVAPRCGQYCGPLPALSAQQWTEDDMKVLITGGMGVIGAETSRKFVSEGHRPVVFARHRDDSLVGDIADKFEFEQGDVLDLPRLLQALQQQQVTHVVAAGACVGA